jgi:flagellar hook assembly protein FlgD
LPDDLKIKIYSIAGRLIQELTVWRANLRIGFNRVPWDGRDRDGDVLSNGVYLYKVVMSIDGKSEEVIQKLVIVK